MKLRKLASVLLAAVFIFSTAAVAMAQDSTQAEEEDTRRSFVGTVTEIEDGIVTLEIKTDDGETSTVSINITDDTQVRVPGKPSEDAGDLSAGDRAVVLAEKKTDGAWQAIHVVVKPNAPTVQPNVGTVVGVEEGEITIQLPNGEEKTIRLPPDAQVPEVGDVVTAFTGKQEDKNVPPMARGLVKAEQIRQRIQEHLRQVSSGNVTAMTQERVRERVQELSNILENHMNRHMTVLDEVLQRVPEQAQEAIKLAKERSSRGKARALEAIQRAQERAGGPPEGAGRPEGTGPGQTGGPNGNGKPEDKGPPRGMGPGQTGAPNGKGKPGEKGPADRPGPHNGNGKPEDRGPTGQTGQSGGEGQLPTLPSPGPPASAEEQGNFRLLISDEANAIGNFTSLNVTISEIGVQSGGESGNWTEFTPHTPEVDLTKLKGANAQEIWSGNLTAGNYTKVFIHVVEEVEGEDESEGEEIGAEIEFEGTINSTEPLTIRDYKVIVGEDTEVEGDLEEGLTARVEGLLQEDGTVLASEIKVQEAEREKGRKGKPAANQ